MKKFLSLILALFLILLSFISCEDKTDKKKTETHYISNTVSSLQHTSHTIANGKCSICGIDIFDELVKLVKEQNNSYKNSDKSGNNTKTYSINYDANSPITGTEYVWIEASQGKKHYYLTIRKGGIQTTTYEWRYSDSTLTKFINIEGTLDPTLLPSDSAFLLKTDMSINRENHRENVTSSEMSYLGNEYSKIIQETLVPLLKNSSTYLTPADYGFINY
jgi:hypothetical protein